MLVPNPDRMWTRNSPEAQLPRLFFFLQYSQLRTVICFLTVEQFRKFPTGHSVNTTETWYVPNTETKRLLAHFGDTRDK